jgi:hypothetical protein
MPHQFVARDVARAQLALEAAAKVMTEDAAPSPIGRQLGTYKVLSLLGAGGMGGGDTVRNWRAPQRPGEVMSRLRTLLARLKLMHEERNAAGIATVSVDPLTHCACGSTDRQRR